MKRACGLRAAAGLLLLLLASCGDGGGSGGGGSSGTGGGGGGGSVCGNGRVEAREDCDPPDPARSCGTNCRFMITMPTRLTVTARVNGDLAMTRSGFDGDSCSEVLTPGRAGFIKLDIQGPASMSMELACSAAAGTVVDVGMAGAYTVTATLTEDNGRGGRTMLAPPASKGVTAVAMMDTPVEIGFPYDTFATSYKGALKFRVEKIGGATSCATAATPVTRQRLKLLKAGQVVMTRTEDAMAGGMPLPGQATDGVAEAACHTPVGPDDLQRIAELLDWGPYDLVVELRDDLGMTRYCKSYPLFVGAGQDNYIFRLDVPAGACP